MPGPRRNFRRAQNPVQTFSRLMNLLSENLWVYIIVILFVVASSLLNIYATYLMGPIFDDGIIPLIGNVTSEGITHLAHLLINYAIVCFASVGFSFAQSRIMVSLGNHTLNKIRNMMFTHMQKLPISFFDKYTHGELMSYYTNDVGTIRDLVSDGITSFISAIVTIVGVLIMMIIISPIMTLTILVLFVVMMCLTTFISKKSMKNFIVQQESVSELNGYMEEMMGGSKVVKVFTHEDVVKEDFNKINEKNRKAATKANIFAGIMGPISNNLAHINYAACSIIGASLCIKNAISIGDLITFLQYNRRFSQPLSQIMQRANTILNALAGAERIFALLDEPIEEDNGKVILVNATYDEEGNFIEAKEHTGLWAWKTSEGELIRLRGDVKFNNVDFSYRPEHQILNDVSFYAKPGQKIAFVGATGAGKTTITNLINRFYDIQEGTILYDGIDIKDISKASLRSSLAMVLQDTHLFTGTVMENIRYGNLNATDEEVIKAAKLANADEFITMLPDGYQTVLTQDGANLSQGQRQLLSIARAAVADAPVLILDEATSSIDTRTEKLIEEGMDNLMAGRTVFVIAHRLSTVRNSNAIMVLDHGVIIERGDHDDLIKQHGKYYSLYTGQFELD